MSLIGRQQAVVMDWRHAWSSGPTMLIMLDITEKQTLNKYE